MSKEDSITGGLGLDEGCFDQLRAIAKKAFSDNNTISDALEAIAEDVRDESLGETNYRVSEYEKKLILAGYITGLVKSQGRIEEIRQVIEEIRQVMALAMASKDLGSIKPVPGGFAGAIDLSGMPPELQEIFKGMFGGNPSEDEDED
jgi:hypothetical protein